MTPLRLLISPPQSLADQTPRGFGAWWGVRLRLAPFVKRVQQGALHTHVYGLAVYRRPAHFLSAIFC